MSNVTNAIERAGTVDRAVRYLEDATVALYKAEAEMNRLDDTKHESELTAVMTRAIARLVARIVGKAA